MPSRKDVRSHMPVLERLLMKMFNSLAGYILGSLKHLGGVRPQRTNVSLLSALKESCGSVHSQCRLLWGFSFRGQHNLDSTESFSGEGWEKHGFQEVWSSFNLTQNLAGRVSSFAPEVKITQMARVLRGTACSEWTWRSLVEKGKPLPPTPGPWDLDSVGERKSWRRHRRAPPLAAACGPLSPFWEEGEGTAVKPLCG